MLSFRQLQEKKTKIKINPKKDEIVEGQKKKKDDSYLETNMKKRQANNEKARKDLMKGPQMKNPHFESTEENAYVSQEEVSEESNQEIEAETETDLTESLPGSNEAKKGSTYASKKDFKAAFKKDPSAFKSALPSMGGQKPGMMAYGKPGNYGSNRPTKAIPAFQQKMMHKSGIGMKGGGSGKGFWDATMKANNASIDKKAGKSAGGKVKKEEVDISLLTFDQYQHAKTLDEEQLNEFLGKLFGGGKSSKPSASSAPPAKPANALRGVMTGAGSSQGSRSMMGRAGQAGAPMSKPPISNSATTGRPSSKQASKPLEKIKKEEVEPVNEFNLGSLFGGGKKPANAGGAAKPSLSDRAVGALQNKGRQGGLGAPVQRMLGRNDATAAAYKQLLGRSKGGKVPAKVRKEEVEQLDEFMPASMVKSGALGKAAKQSIKPGGNNSLGIKTKATSAGGGLTFTNNARLLARMPAQYTRGTVPQPPKSAPKVNSSANAVKPGMGSSSSKVGTASTTGANKPVTSSGSKAMTNRVKHFNKVKTPKKMPEQHLRSFGSFLKERTRYAKETGKDFTTGNPSEKGGEGRSEVGKHMQKVMRPTGGAMSSRKKAIQPQGKKKEKGKKGPKGVTPVDKIKNQLARKRAPKKDPYGYGQGRYQGD